MKLNVYSIFDKAANAYTQPFFMQNDGLAIRAFQDNVNDEGSNNIAKHPDQFTLFKIGEFNDQTAEIVPSEVKKSLGNGIEYKDQKIGEELATDIMAKLDEMYSLLKEV